MEGCLVRLQESLDSLPVTERKAAVLFLESPEKVIEMQLDEVCFACGVSASSVVRLSKRLGYNGFKSLCRAISVDLALQNANKPLGNITADSSYDEICRSVCYTNVQAIENTLAIIDYEEFAKAVSAIVNAKRVDMYGIATSENVCRDGSMKFMRLNKISITSDDPHWQILAASTLKPGDVAILVSYTGITIDTLETMKAVKKSGATAISITKYGDNPIADLADIKLYVQNSENIFRISATGSRISHLAMIDMLSTAVCSRMYSEIEPHLEETRAMMNRKRMHIL